MKNKIPFFVIRCTYPFGNHNFKYSNFNYHTFKIQTISLLAFFVVLFSNAVALNSSLKSQQNTFHISMQNNSSLQILYVNMFVQLSNGSMSLADGVATAYYPTYHNAVDGQDALKLNTFFTKQSLSILRNGVQLAIERRQTIVSYDTTFLQIIQMTNGKYEFQFLAQNFNPLIAAVLVDKFTGNSTIVNLQMTDTTKYDFIVNSSNPASANQNRFALFFSPQSDMRISNTLPVTISNVDAFEQENSVKIQWNVENEVNIEKYIVEKSTDAINFTSINSQTPSSENTLSKQYDWVDATPSSGICFYRIGYQDKGGNMQYSKIVKITLSNTASSSIKIYPTIIDNSETELAFINMKSGIYHVRMINNIGQTVFIKTINHIGGSSTQSISFENRTNKGIYQLNISGPDNYFSTVKLLNR